MGNKQLLKNNKKLSLVMILSTVLVLVVWIMAGILLRRAYPNSLVMADGWTIDVCGERHENVTLQEFKFNGLDDGDTIDMYYQLDDRFNNSTSIELLGYLATVRAWIGDREVYSRGVEEYALGKFVGSGYNFIKLPEDCSGEVLHIELVITSLDAMTNIPDPIAAPTGEIYRYFASKNFISFFVNFFLIMFGGLCTVIGLTATFYSREYFKLGLIGLFSLLIGTWAACSSKLWLIFDTRVVTTTLLEYICLYFAPVAFGLLLWDMRKKNHPKNAKIILWAISVLAVFDVVVFALHFSGLMFLPRTLVAFHGVAFCILLILIYFGLIAVKNKTRSDKVTTVATFILTFAVIFDLIRFNLQKYLVPEASVLMNSFLPVGTLIFVVFLITAYVFQMYDMILSNAEKQMLVGLAYKDELTGLYNRVKYNEIAESAKAKKNYALVNIDLNGLKATNDKFGHLSGDLLLKEYASLLKKSFENVGSCYRMGGDEFLVFVDDNKINEIDFCLNTMMDEQKIHSEKIGINISASYGVATLEECENKQIGAVYSLADSRMYEMKQLYKLRKNNT